MFPIVAAYNMSNSFTGKWQVLHSYRWRFCLVSIYKITALDIYTVLSEHVKRGISNFEKATMYHIVPGDITWSQRHWHSFALCVPGSMGCLYIVWLFNLSVSRQFGDLKELTSLEKWSHIPNVEYAFDDASNTFL